MLSSRPVVAPTRTDRALPKAFVRPACKSCIASRQWRLQVALSDASVSESVGANVTGSAASIDASIDAPVVGAKVPWYKKPCAFKELESVEALQTAVLPENNGGRMTVVDFYAGWCACCKSSFTALCRIPNNDLLAQNFNFYKANIEEGDFASFIKKRGVRGIPYVLVFGSDGRDLIGMGASFKKMELLRKNLDFIARADQKDFVLDPNGNVMNR